MLPSSISELLWDRNAAAVSIVDDTIENRVSIGRIIPTNVNSSTSISFNLIASGARLSGTATALTRELADLEEL
jgi:hypothetical protein